MTQFGAGACSTKFLMAARREAVIGHNVTPRKGKLGSFEMATGKKQLMQFFLPSLN